MRQATVGYGKAAERICSAALRVTGGHLVTVIAAPGTMILAGWEP